MEKPVVGKVSLISPALDPNSTTVEVWVQAANPDQQLRPGATARVSMTAQTVRGAVVVPASALLNAKEDSAQVMVVDDKGQAQGRDVKIGIRTGDQAQVLSGIAPGEVVITQGAYGLPDKTKVKVEKPESAEAEGAADKDKDKKEDAAEEKGGDKPRPGKNGEKNGAAKNPDKKDKD